MSNQIKVIQSRLKRRGISVTLEQVREAIAQFQGSYDDEMELTDEICTSIAEFIKENRSAPLANRDSQQDESALLANTTPLNLSVGEKNKIINAVAKEIDVSLPIEALRDIAHSVDWAIDSRLELMKQLRSQIQLWTNHKLQEVQQVSNEIRNDTNLLIAQVSSTINNAIEEDNESFRANAEEMKQQVEQAVEKFRNSHAQIVGIFSLPT